MSSGRRRSNRLIESPWVFNWKKKNPVFVDLEDGRSSVNLALDKLSPKEARKESMDNDRVRGGDTTEDEDDFVTPGEKFTSSGKKRPAQSGTRDAGSNSSRQGKLVRSRQNNNVPTESFKDFKLDTELNVQSNGLIARKGLSADKRQKVDVDVLGTSRMGEGGRVPRPQVNQGKPKKARSYDGYIQKKFAPLIMTDVIANLSPAQRNWVISTGFKHLLHFRMTTYPHRLGYNVVNAFCSRSCALRVKGGDVLITEKLVHNIMGLPLGDGRISLKAGRLARTPWDEQYPSNAITPKMIRDKLLESRTVDYNFKMNFLILVYNFFIQGNQNSFVARDMLSFRGNIDNCGEYNWCSLLIEKLKKTHQYWSAEKWRNFSGPLPFLIENEVVPWYRRWSDMLLRERQQNETDVANFGNGVIVSNQELAEDGGDCEAEKGVDDNAQQNVSVAGAEHDEEEQEDEYVKDMGEGVELSMIELVVADSLSCGDAGDEKEINDNASHSQDEVAQAPVHTGKEPKGRVASEEDNLGGATGFEPNTQARADIELENHFDEEPYMNRFEANLQELEEVYNRCLTNYVDSLALFPENKKLAELVRRYKQFFKMFGDSSPITKSLRHSKTLKGKEVAVEQDGNEVMPNFSLGLSQMFPKNLGSVMDSCPITPKRVGAPEEYPEDDSPRGIGNPPLKVRPRRGIFPTAICRSPYVTRLVDITRHHLSAEERDVWDWLCHDGADEKEYIFEWKSRECSKAHFRSLVDNQLVESTVIDTWTYLLNENEILRAVSSPLRLFLTSETILGYMQMDIGGGDVMGRLNRYAVFDDNMEIVLKLVNEIHCREYEVSDFEMFLFPVFNGVHHYIVCYNIKKPAWEIIDNQVQHMSFEETYGDLPWRLHDCFCQFLECYSLGKQAGIAKLQPEVISMSWQTTDNVVDCGVFVMRHLESYMGNGVTWKSGLRTERAFDFKKLVVDCNREVRRATHETMTNLVTVVACRHRAVSTTTAAGCS
ncbi:hypothetical protein ACET3Z_026449 [Daucus carota]